MLGLFTIHIRQNGFECTTSFVSHGMLFVSEPSHEVIHSDVVRVLNDVMNDTFVGVTFGVKEDRARFFGEGLEHEAVGILGFKTANYWVYEPSFAAVGFSAFFAHSGTMPKFLFNAVCAHEIAFFSVCPEDFAAC